MKAFVDRASALVALVGLAPLFVLIALSIKADDGGAVLFNQLRAGKDGEPFLLFKFRTMIPDADDFLDSEGRPTRQRVTKTGRILRRWSLDELPQLANVLMGQMSLVGPRPVPLEYAERMSSHQRRRFEMRPGLTGLAQVTGRHSLSWSERVELDIKYVENFSLAHDARIVLRTLPTLLDSQTLTERGDPRKVDLG